MIYRPVLRFLFQYLLPVLILSQPATAQVRDISGIVTDERGEPLVFVTIMLNDDRNRGTLTDIEGRFTLSVQETVRSLSFRYVGYDSLRLGEKEIAGRDFLKVVMREKEAALSEVVIRAGENPAHRIIRRAIDNRLLHHPERLSSYQCKTYNKINFQIVTDSLRFREFASGKDTSSKEYTNLYQNFDTLRMAETDHYIFLMESVTKRSFKAPDQIQEEVLLNRTSGVPESSIVAISNAIQPFSFYDEYLRILDKQFLNPISSGSTGKYFFNIEDTLYKGKDTVFIISFRPLKDKIFDALSGVLHIHTNGYAISNVRAYPTKPLNLDLLIEQQYQWLPESEQWFPEQLNFEISLPKYPGPYIGTQINGISYIRDILVDPPLRLSAFDPDLPLKILPGASQQSDSLWQVYHEISPLTAKEQRTYEFIDSLGKKENFKLLAKLSDVLTTGKWRIKGILSADLNRVIAFNQFENMRFGIGLTTANPLPLRQGRRFDISAYTGYGLRDKAWKYGGELKLRFVRSEQHTLSLSYQNDLLEPGALHELAGGSLVNRTFYTQYMDGTKEWSLQLRNRLAKGIQTRLFIQRQELTPTYLYAYGDETPGDTLRRYQFAEAGIYAKVALNQTAQTLFGEEFQSVAKVPVFEMAYIRGISGIAGGQYDYHKYLLAISQSFSILHAGQMTYRIEAGWLDGDVPFSKLFTLNQSGGRSSGLFYVNNTFQTTEDSILWLSDRFVNLYFAHRFGRVFKISEHSQPDLSLLHNMSWGGLRHPERHQYIDFQTATQPLLESGIRLDNLLMFNYVNFAYLGLGGTAYYRWGANAYDDWKKNISLRFSLRLNL